MLELWFILCWSAAFVALLSSLITSNFLDFRVAHLDKKLGDAKACIKIQREAIDDLMEKLDNKRAKNRELESTIEKQHETIQDLLVARMSTLPDVGKMVAKEGLKDMISKSSSVTPRKATKTEDPL